MPRFALLQTCLALALAALAKQTGQMVTSLQYEARTQNNSECFVWSLKAMKSVCFHETALHIYLILTNPGYDVRTGLDATNRSLKKSCFYLSASTETLLLHYRNAAYQSGTFGERDKL